MPSTITRWDPAQDFAHLRGTMGRLVNQRFMRLPGLRGNDERNASSLELDIMGASQCQRYPRPSLCRTQQPLVFHLV